MFNFIFVALCTWITTFLPFKDVCVPSANEEVVEVIERKNRNNLVSNNGYSVIGITDILTVEVIDSLLSTYDVDYLSNNAVGRTFSFFSLTNDVCFVSYQYAYYSTGHEDFGYNSDGITLNNFNFVCRSYHTHSNRPLKWLDYTMNINSSSYSVSIEFTVFCNNNSTSSQPLWVDITTFSHNTGSPYCIVMKNTSTLYSAFTNNSQESFNNGYDSGYSSGYDEGYDNGLSYGEGHPNQDLVDEIYDRGYAYGYSEGLNSDAVLSTIFTGILDVSFIPVNIFIQMFNYEILGVNIAGLISGLMTVALLLILMRFITGRRV